PLRAESEGLDDEDGISSMSTIAQFERRHEAELRLVPLPGTPDHRVHRPLKVKANPHKTLTMLSMGVPFAFSIEDLRAAWQIASPAEQEQIEHIVSIQQQKENAA
ncbi:hypothetical protein, partial [Corynebacterium casei]